MTVFILPTRSPVAYRGKYPNRARSISGALGNTGRHIELNCGIRLWSCDDRTPEFNAGALSDDYGSTLDRAVQMTAAQYATLLEAAALLRTRAGIAGHGRRAELESQVSAMVKAIQPDGPQLAKRNAEAARRRCSARDMFRTDRPFRVYNRTPNFSACFDFATLAEAREYLAAQLDRRDSVISGAAPVGPDSNSQDPLESFIVWAGGTETLAESPWNYEAVNGRYWAKAAPAIVGAIESAPVKGRLPGISVRHTGGEYRVTFTDEAIAAAFPAMNRAQRTAKAEAVACYESDRGAAYETGESMAKRGLVAAVETVRRDNVEYHAGKAARQAGTPVTANPYPESAFTDSRSARWTLGWNESAPVETISVAMTWTGAAGIIRAALENGTGEGRRMARIELDRMAATADKGNAARRLLDRMTEVAAQAPRFEPLADLVAEARAYLEAR